MHVLVIEDDRNGAETLRRTLIAAGWIVALADNGEDGLFLATNNSYDAIVCDIMMPKLSGYEVVRQLRHRGNWTPVLMLTAKDGDYDQIDAFDLGADDYLIKPFSTAVLTARLRALVRRGAPERPAILTAGTLTLDPAAHIVRRGETEIDVTPKEFAILEFLIRNKGAVVSKAEIMQSAWDAHYQGDQNIVEVYVGYLRRHIDTPFDCKAIRTVRGVGYRLTEDGR
ncbi:DNA-binding response regulator [Williamsia sp. 1138]|uniref:response regulator transcription factor n=1 Tax=Williamsia sp. 1138 TaxID=1903117 RepID=UPI000A112BE4|nr:response regulator transcription factor [Williamsia sp. 1138]OZG29887.1 DNA-binding response regulator [Williamsia sp. 1138]